VPGTWPSTDVPVRLAKRPSGSPDAISGSLYCGFSLTSDAAETRYRRARAAIASVHELPRPRGDAMKAVIRTEGLCKRYGSTLALEGLDLAVGQGEVYGYLGPNGSGKTTTIRLLLGLHRPSGGRAELFGLDAWREPVAAHRRVAYVAGEPFLWPALTSAETFEFLARVRGGSDASYREELIERFQLDASKRVRALSKGNRQKVQLVAAFASRADLLILDEPTSGLDPLMEVAFRETVREAKQRGQTIFLSSHILSEVEALCDRVGILRAGRLVDEGTLAELRHLSAQTIEVTFGGPAPSLPELPGISVASAGSNALRFEVSGSVAPLIAALAEHPVLALTSREPSLEEIFLHHYEGSAGHVGR
jgi:ABC-2 type transport system ATP-binding protein